jgi:predicted nucleic acid-binding protein
LNLPKPIISDTTLISNFASVKRIDLLVEVLGHPLFTTAQVVDEISAGVRAGYKALVQAESLLLTENSPFEILALNPEELQSFRNARLRLHAGEARCLAVALHRKYVLGTDDLAARKIAHAKNIPVIGTIGVLVLCRRGLLTLDEANRVLNELISSGYRSPVTRLDGLWK